MTKKLFTTIIALSAFAPLFASAQIALNVNATGSAPTNGTATEAQLLTSCAQAAIDVRDSSISSARTAYNNQMAVALDARKDAEKKAIALDSDDAKKDAIKSAVDAYKKAVTQAQDALTKARKDAWAQFEGNTNECRDMSKEKGTIAPATAGLRTMQAGTLMKADAKAVITEDKAEGKSIKDTLKDALKALFKFSSSDTTSN